MWSKLIFDSRLRLRFIFDFKTAVLRDVLVELNSRTIFYTDTKEGVKFENYHGFEVNRGDIVGIVQRVHNASVIIYGLLLAQ